MVNFAGFACVLVEMLNDKSIVLTKDRKVLLFFTFMKWAVLLDKMLPVY